MNLLSQLSSESGDKTQKSNCMIVAHCLEEPALLAEINEGLKSGKAALIGDCAEVFTKVAEDRPELVVPYVQELIPLLTHKTTRVRWESMHAIALIAAFVPDVITALLPQLDKMLDHDSSTIVRDYAIETLGNYAKAGEKEALLAYPLLEKSLKVWEGRHRGRALNGLLHLLESVPNLAEDLRMIAGNYLDDSKGVVKKVAKQLAKTADNLLYSRGIKR